MKTFKQLLLEIQQATINKMYAKFNDKDLVNKYIELHDKNKLVPDDRDWQKIKDLSFVVNKYKDKLTRTEKRNIRKEDVDVVFENDKSIIYKPKNYTGSCALTWLSPVQAKELGMPKAKWCTGADSDRGKKSWINAIAFDALVSFWIIDLKDGTNKWAVQVNVDNTIVVWDVLNKKHDDTGYFNNMLKDTGIPKKIFTDEIAKIIRNNPNVQQVYRGIINSLDLDTEDYDEMKTIYGEMAVEFIKRMRNEA